MTLHFKGTRGHVWTNGDGCPVLWRSAMHGYWVGILPGSDHPERLGPGTMKDGTAIDRWRARFNVRRALISATAQKAVN